MPQVPPPSCHPAGKEYTLFHGNLLDIQIITSEERRILLDLAKSFNKIVTGNNTANGDASANNDVAGNRPGDVFNRQASWLADIFTPHRWTMLDEKERRDGDGKPYREQYFMRQGKSTRAPRPP